MQSSKACSSTSSSKSKRNSKDQEKRKSQSQSAANPTESNKSSPSKESKGYVGITADSIRHFDGESCKVSDVAFDALAEDINYKLRYIIHNSLIQARLLGRNSITSDDVDEVFDNLNIEKIYGATANPNWIQFEDQNLHHLALDEIKVNLIELAEEDNVYGQEADIILEAT
ncbi:uncharacterized protein LOC132705092 isoform X2 [Cylas formicarius]|nr:uncharacterized protein LOC132705092 isoform X2 [Cylas formicarius]